jgi:hypothetical protein
MKAGGGGGDSERTGAGGLLPVGRLKRRGTTDPAQVPQDEER